MQDGQGMVRTSRFSGKLRQRSPTVLCMRGVTLLALMLFAVGFFVGRRTALGGFRCVSLVSVPLSEGRTLRLGRRTVAFQTVGAGPGEPERPIDPKLNASRRSG